MRIGEAVRKRIIALCEENKITVNMLADNQWSTAIDT